MSRIDTLTDLQLERLMHVLRRLHELLGTRYPHFSDQAHLKAILESLDVLWNETPLHRNVKALLDDDYQ